MLISPTLLVAFIVTLVGSLIVWSNPGRAVNRLVFSCSVHIAGWLTFLFLSRMYPAGSPEGTFWFRNTFAISASLPLHLFFVKEAVAGLRPGLSFLWSPRSAAWIVATALLSILPLTYYFIPADSVPGNLKFGWGHAAYHAGIPLLYVLLVIDVIRNLKRLEGARRLELQVWLIGGCAAASAILVLAALHQVSGTAEGNTDIYVSLQPYVALLFYVGTAYVVTTARVFDARQIMRVGAEKLFMMLLVGLLAFDVDYGLTGLLNVEPVIALLVTVGVAVWFAGLLRGRLNRWFRFYPEATAARQAAFEVAHREVGIDQLWQEFVQLLRGWGQTDNAALLYGAKGAIAGGGIELPEAGTMVDLMRELRWATPERLARERTTPERETLRRFLQDQKLGVLVLGEGTALSVMVGVGVPASRRPFTYPQVTQLMELTSIIEGAMERAHYSMKAQHAEQLATVGMLGAGLAHEIRNPLVTIKTFVQLLPQHYAEAPFRNKFFRLISDEVTRIDRLTEQLLDMASPRVYEAEAMALHPLLRTSLELVAAKAADRKIRIIVDFAAVPDVVITDGSAAKQVLLNLALNAIHAVEPVAGERWIRVATRNNSSTVEMSVADNGPGIAPEIMPRLFQPFQSTKSSGFGLGLAICSDILSGLKATIAADPPRPGTGATFRVNFPCPPPLS